MYNTQIYKQHVQISHPSTHTRACAQAHMRAHAPYTNNPKKSGNAVAPSQAKARSGNWTHRTGIALTGSDTDGSEATAPHLCAAHNVCWDCARLISETEFEFRLHTGFRRRDGSFALNQDNCERMPPATAVTQLYQSSYVPSSRELRPLDRNNWCRPLIL